MVWTYLLSRLLEIDQHGWECLPRIKVRDKSLPVN